MVIFLKRIILIFLLAFILSSCTVSFESASDVMDNLTLTNGIIYRNGSDISEDTYISAEKLGYLYYAESSPLNELSCIESYCIYVSKGKSISEIHILEAGYQSDTDTLKRMLTSRAELISKPRINPNPSNFFCDVGCDVAVFSKGRFVFLVAGNNEAKRCIEEMFDSNV